MIGTLKAAQQGNRLETEAFIEWCEQQIEQSQSITARIIKGADGESDEIRFRLREEGSRGPEDIILIKGKNADTIRFKRGEKVDQYHLHRRRVTLSEKTLTVRDKKHNLEITRAGTGDQQQRGPFPV